MVLVLKYLLGAVLVAICAVVLLMVFGPRERVQVENIKSEFNLGDDVEAYLADKESRFSDIKEGQQKQIIWADPANKSKTEFSIVYVHGYSASSVETRPLTDIMAKELGANLFYTRLPGHGRGGDAMAEPFARHWLSDTAEALEVGRAIGDKVIVVSASTGSTLVSWALTDDQVSKDVHSSVFISPNFGVVNPAAMIFTWPFARTIVPIVAGERRVWYPKTELEKQGWTSDYPSTALVTMGVAVDFAKSLDYSEVKVPTYFSYSPKDAVVASSDTDEIYDRWGGPKARKYVEVSGDPLFHVNAGDAKSPITTQPLAEELVSWIRSIQ